MNDPSPSRRRFRLQVSLRMLLALMLLAGIALTIYRWPWVEVVQGNGVKGTWNRQLFDDPPPAELRTTYRRDWRARPVKHGVEQKYYGNRLREEEHYYDGELHGSKKIFDEDGQLIFAATYRHGELHGPFRAGKEKIWYWEGNYVRNQWHGAWRTLKDPDSAFHIHLTDYQLYGRTTSSFQEGEPVIHSQWRHGQRHGHWTWQQPEGTVLRSADYEHDEIVRWNGEPVVEQFWEWLRGPEVNDRRLVEQWTAANVALKTHPFGRGGWELPFTYLASDALCLDVDGLRLIVHCPHAGDYRWSQFPPFPQRLVPALCEYAACEELRFEARYDALWLIPKKLPPGPRADITGVASVEFESGSQPARDWNAVMDVQASEGYARECIEHVLKGTKIAVDLEGVSRHTYIGIHQPDRGSDRWRLFKRRRRDVLGYVLYRTGYRCELRDGKLIILPRENRSADEIDADSRCQPLKPLETDPFG